MCSALLVGSLLSCAERLAPGELSIVATSTYTSRKPIQLPCFDRTDSMDLPRTKSIDLTLGDFRLLPPKAGNCPAERLALEGCHFDAAALLPRCPRLRVLQVGPNAKLASDSSRTIHYLPLLEELVLEDCIDGLRFHIVAPMLNHLSLFTHIKDASVSAENLEKLSLDCSRNLYNIELGNMGGLREVMLWIFRYRHRLLIHKGVRTLMQQLPHLRLLSVNISLQRMTAFKGLIDENAFVGLQKLPKTSMLMLQLSTFGHRYRKTVLLLLKMFEGIEELIMLIDSPKSQEVSAPGFHCSNEVWTSEDLSLPLLKKVEFKGFTGSKSAVYVLKLLLTSAKVLEQMTVTLCNKDSTGYEGRKQQLFNIFNSYPTVKCQVLHA
uniref:Uncharacterized protein n=1 Tax=Arundo donax TaxID=35708 RepID=A0A0A9EBK8_ARUDO